jgi:serine/threonine protein kinase HipA of HipAB toxin-antitoxin module
MSRYTVDRVLWNVYRSGEDAAAFSADAKSYLANFDLTGDERELLEQRAIRALLESGAHPFLVYSFEMRLAGGFSMELVGNYLGQVGGLVLGDIET